MFVLHILLTAIVAIIILAISWYFTVPKNLPPGPLGFPFIGCSIDTWKASTLPEQLMKWKRQFGALYKLYVGEKLIVVLGDWNLIQEALVKQGDASIGRPKFHTILLREDAGTGLLDTEGEIWKVQRRFALSTLRDFGFGRPIIEPRIKDEAEYLLEAITNNNQNPFDPAPLLQNASANVISALVFGRRFDYDDKNFHGMLKIMRSRLSEMDVSFMAPIVLSERIAKIMSILPWIRNLKSTNSHMTTFFQEQTAQTLKNFDSEKGDEPTNYIQAFYKAQHDQEHWSFSDDQLIASVASLFIAGTDTTAATLRWGIYYMAKYPEVQEKVYEEIRRVNGVQSLLSFADRVKLPYMEATIMEIQRMANLLPIGVMRRTVASIKLCAYDIPADTILVPFLTAAMRDPKVYPNPDVFNPCRFLDGRRGGEKGAEFAYLMPFQAGKRICLGESLAKMELFVFFAAMMSRFKFSFCDDKDGDKAPLFSVFRTPPKFNVCANMRTE